MHQFAFREFRPRAIAESICLVNWSVTCPLFRSIDFHLIVIEGSWGQFGRTRERGRRRRRKTGRRGSENEGNLVGWLVGCLTSQQQASVSRGRICSDNFTCCHTEIEVADPTFYLTQSQYTDTGPTSPSADPITPGAWQGSDWSANF